MSSSFQSKSAPSVAVFDPAWWKIAAALFIALVLQTTLLRAMEVRGARLSLVFLLVLWFAVHAGVRRGALFGAIAGLCEDALGASGVAWTIADAAAGAIAAALARTPLGDSLLLAPPAVMVLSLVRYVLFLVALRIEHGASTAVPSYWHAALWQSLFNAGAALLALLIAQRMELPYGINNRN
ncbi:MAG TPA: hypothetical protein VGD50_07895 [Candidatus Baltobacteraceae bacterium]